MAEEEGDEEEEVEEEPRTFKLRLEFSDELALPCKGGPWGSYGREMMSMMRDMMMWWFFYLKTPFPSLP